MKKQKNFGKKVLTKPKRYDIIEKHSEKRGAKTRETSRRTKKFEKNLKNLLTNSKRCGIMIKLPDGSGNAERGCLIRITQTAP